MKRGDTDQLVRNDNELWLIKWKDNKGVVLLSSATGQQPTDNVSRWSKADNKRILVDRPNVIRVYNEEMLGVDLLDRFISYYRINIRTKKWPVRVYFHFIDFAAVNSWVEYRSNATKAGIPKRKQMSLLEFKMYISKSLMAFFSMNSTPIQVRRPTKRSLEGASPPCPPKRKISVMPVSEVRFDQHGHFPEGKSDAKQSRCRMEGCKSRSRVRCTKCNIYLCIFGNNCFLKFHTKN
ncbi:Uncharacterised protein r2_g777 [Pycnogonum litorale]